MARTVAIGIQDFGDLIKKNCFYVDKTYFIRDWWENEDVVTLITRPRRFGKTLTMSMLECFFSIRYAEQGILFENLDIWSQEKYRKLQGTFPVISLSFANIKGNCFLSAKEAICQTITNLYVKYSFLRDSNVLTDKDRDFFDRVSVDMRDADAALSLHQLSDYLYRYYGKKVIILLDEYDTPVQEAYVSGYWDEMVAFIRSLFNSSFKTNPYLERAIMTGITRVSKESIFSDLNHLKVVTTTSDDYAEAFGFTESEVFAAMDEFGMANKDEVKAWYDGFIFGTVRDIYNPWSVINLLDTGKLKTYWANTSANSLIGKLIREGNRDVKLQFESLLCKKSIQSDIDEEIIYDQLEESDNAIWSLLLASGYLKVLDIEESVYHLALTNYEVEQMFDRMVRSWFGKAGSDYNDFVKALLAGDVDAMNEYMNRVARQIFSYFDTGGAKAASEPERFYHGFILGLIVELEGRYAIRSNRESGFGRYDVILEPLKQDDAIIIEFKVFQPKREKTLSETVQTALQQIEDREYEQVLTAHGILPEHIRKYGFAFQGKNVLIG